jgi:hypothetical protein
MTPILAGDLNARIASLTGDSNNNSNGKLLQELLNKKKLIIANAKWEFGTPTYTSAAGNSIPDIVATERKNDIIKYLAIDKDTIFDNDHRPIIFSTSSQIKSYTPTEHQFRFCKPTPDTKSNPALNKKMSENWDNIKWAHQTLTKACARRSKREIKFITNIQSLLCIMNLWCIKAITQGVYKQKAQRNWSKTFSPKLIQRKANLKKYQHSKKELNQRIKEFVAAKHSMMLIHVIELKLLANFKESITLRLLKKTCLIYKLGKWKTEMKS